jgi:hypothetical protein
MIKLELKLSKSDVYAEVDKSTDFAGVKGSGAESPGTYERVSSTSADHQMFDKWWTEACSVFVEMTKQFMTRYSVDKDSGDIEIELELSSAYDDVLNESIQSSMRSFFVDYILQKWYGLTNAEAGKEMMTEASGLMNDILAKLFYRKRPKKRVASQQE